MFYSISVDGKEIHRVENKEPRSFQDVTVLAGNRFFTAADASYRNLTWDIGDSAKNLEGNYEHKSVSKCSSPYIASPSRC